MKSSYAIAYASEDGRDFNGIPWLLDDFNNKEECISKALEMILYGYKNVVSFQFEQKRKKNEEFNWEYVKKNEIALD